MKIVSHCFWVLELVLYELEKWQKKVRGRENHWAMLLFLLIYAWEIRMRKKWRKHSVQICLFFVAFPLSLFLSLWRIYFPKKRVSKFSRGFFVCFGKTMCSNQARGSRKWRTILIRERCAGWWFHRERARKSNASRFPNETFCLGVGFSLARSLPLSFPSSFLVDLANHWTVTPFHSISRSERCTRGREKMQDGKLSLKWARQTDKWHCE